MKKSIDIILKKLLLLVLVLGVCALPCSAEDDTSEETEADVQAKKEAAEKEQELKEQFEYSFNDIADLLVIIECESSNGRSSGSGFIAKMDGKTYLFTNQHVILGTDKIKFRTATGRMLRPRKVELSMTRDIARLLLADEEGLAISSSTSMGVPIAVFGNSEGSGVATELYGEVSGIGADVVEVSADFVKGNSGSPVLNPDKEVIGIASYLRYSRKQRDTEGTKFENQTRRFCYRLTGTQWKAVNWKAYNKRYGMLYRTHTQLTDSIFEIIDQWSDDPFGKVGAEDHSDLDLRRWSNAHNNMVNRIVRLSDKGTASVHRLENTNKQIRKDISDSAEALSAVCEGNARRLRMLSTQRELTGFLRKSFEDHAGSLEFASKWIDLFGTKLSGINYFRFSNEN